MEVLTTLLVREEVNGWMSTAIVTRKATTDDSLYEIRDSEYGTGCDLCHAFFLGHLVAPIPFLLFPNALLYSFKSPPFENCVLGNASYV